jgi:hypothetical protein
VKISELALVVGLLVACVATLGLATKLYRERRSRTRLLSNPPVPDMIVSPSHNLLTDVRFARSSFARPEAIRFERTTGHSALEVRIPSKKYMEAHSWKKLELSEQSSAWLSPFLKNASEALKVSVLAQLASTQTFRIVFDGAGELMRSQSGDGFRSILVDKHSRHVISHGLLQPAAHTAANGLLLWECAAVLVGRKYLADIDRRLNRIDTGIADIKAFLENERVGKLQADCKLLSDIAGALLDDPSFLFRNPAIQISLEAVEQNASAVARACLLDLQSIRSGLVKADPLKAFSDADLTPVNDAVSKSVHTLQAVSFALSLRICCAAYLCNYMDSDHLKGVRLEDVLTLWNNANEESKKTQLVTKDKIDSISEWLSFDSTVEAKKQRARSEVNGFFLEADHALESSRNEMKIAGAERSVLGAATAPLELAVTVDRKGKFLTVLLSEQPA